MPISTTRREIVIDTLKTLRDLRVLTATRTGSDVILWDDANLNGEPGAYAGREVLFAAGTAPNIGKVRYVTGSSDRGIGFGVALPSATAIGDEAWMINTRGIGYRFADVYDAINHAIRDAAVHGPVPTAIDESSYVRGDAIAIPPNFVTVENIQWQDGNDETVWHTIRKARKVHDDGWWVDRFDRTIGIGGNSSSKIDGKLVRVWGLAAPELMYDDDDETTINAAWLTASAAGFIARGKFMSSPTPETERTMFQVMQDAVAYRPTIVTRRSPFSEAV